MKNYDLNYENKYNNMIIAGTDEAGRGPLAGPVVIACVIMPLEQEKIIDGVNDSKKLTAKKRQELYPKILKNALSYSIVEIDNCTIDQINILNATKLGMKQALESLSIKPEIILTDAVKIDTDIIQENIVKGDSKSYNIACASILAKVYRDNLMEAFDKEYPQYQFSKHKGYGTKLHIENLKKFGKCKIHRDTFIKHFIYI